MRSRALFVVCLLSVAVTSLTTAQSSFLHLNPGGLSDLPETVPVNVVFVGYEPSLINQSSFLSILPETYKPIVRSRFFYGVTEELGLQYQFAYNVIFTSTTWENGFFAALSGLATPAPRTLFQDQYNEQLHTCSTWERITSSMRRRSKSG